MKYYVIRDGKIQAQTLSKIAALNLIKVYQEKEKHPFIRSEYSIIEGKPQEFIKYPKTSRR